MITDSIRELEYYIGVFPNLIKAINNDDLNYRRSPKAWSKKEIVGHLIDSATINLTRFVVGQFEANPTLHYDQDLWCRHNIYQDAAIKDLVKQWHSTNSQLVFIWKNLSSDSLSRLVNDQTLAFLAADYVAHLVHHINQIAHED